MCQRDLKLFPLFLQQRALQLAHTGYTKANLWFVASINVKLGVQVPLWGSRVSQQSGYPCIAITV